jgi:hypothetical protein
MMMYRLVVGICWRLRVRVPYHEDVLIGLYLWRLVDERFKARP